MTNDAIVAIRVRSPLFRGLRNYVRVDDKSAGYKIVPVVASARDVWPQQLVYFCPGNVLEFTLREGAGDATLSWAVELRCRPFALTFWKDQWDHLSAHGVTSMEVLCVDQNMHLSTMCDKHTDGWCYGWEYVFDSTSMPKGKETRVHLTPELCGMYHPGVVRRLSSRVMWADDVEDLYAEVEEAKAAEEAAAAKVRATAAAAAAAEEAEWEAARAAKAAAAEAAATENTGKKKRGALKRGRRSADE